MLVHLSLSLALNTVILSFLLLTLEVQAFQRGAYGSAQLGGRSSGLAHTHLLDQL